MIDLDASLAIHAARLSLELELPMADGIILATAREHEAVLWTQNADIKGIENVRYRKRRP